MPAQTIEPKQSIANPTFIGLESYSEEQADMFFGRDEEIKTLYKLIKNNTLTIVFGKSGTGKTSLLNAGVFPRLRADYCLPFRIRLEYLDNSPNLVMQVKNIMRSAIETYGFKVESFATTETLWEYFHKEPLWNIITPILIFDQFEEIFTIAGKSERFKKGEVDDLIEELSDLIENTIPEKIKERFVNGKEEDNFNFHKPKAKIIFSFREDFLPEIESITAKIPSVKHSRFRLKQMNGLQAYEVITKTWGNAINPSEANKIVYFFTNEPEITIRDEEERNIQYSSFEVEPSLLSQVCSSIEKKRLDENGDSISATFLSKNSKDLILRSIYDKVLEESKTIKNDNELNKNPIPRNLVKEFMEDKLITDEGYRLKYATTKIDSQLILGIDIVKRKYFIREEGETIELTHDVIVTLVKSDREKRRKQLALMAEKERARNKMKVILLFAVLALLLLWIVLTVPAFIIRSELKDDQKNLQDSIRILDSIKNKLLIPTPTVRLPKKIKTPGYFPVQPRIIRNNESPRLPNKIGVIATRLTQPVQGTVNDEELKKKLKELQEKSDAFEKNKIDLLYKQRSLDMREEYLAGRQKEIDESKKAMQTLTITEEPTNNAKPKPRQKKGKIFGYGYDYHVETPKKN
ncbi:MAG: ATP-binding protein [Chitinophagaceae bacterium]|nr:ATP-binding protein [Chitinophagaceae bacterium]